MTIKEVCQKYGITADTLRYYEKAGVIPEVHRTAGGIRDYTPEDLNWVENALCMRNAGLPVDVVIEYVRLYQQGDETIEARLQLLVNQKKELEQQKATIENTLDKLNYKISRYEEAVRTGKLNWD